MKPLSMHCALLVQSTTLLVFWGRVARAEALPAEPCVGGVSALAAAPVQLTAGPSGLGSLPETCPGSDVRLRAAGAALVARDDFYGLLTTTVQAGVRYRLSQSGWLSLMLPGLDYKYSANATIEASSASLSAGAVGYHHALRLSSRWLLSPWIRSLLPTETSTRLARRYAIEQGFSIIGEVAPHVTWLAGAAYPLYVIVNGGARYYVLMQTYVSEVAYHPWPALSAVLGGAIRIRAGEQPAFEGFDPRLALRLHVARALHAELAAAAPLWGKDRTDLLASFSLFIELDKRR